MDRLDALLAGVPYPFETLYALYCAPSEEGARLEATATQHPSRPDALFDTLGHITMEGVVFRGRLAERKGEVPAAACLFKLLFPNPQERPFLRQWAYAPQQLLWRLRGCAFFPRLLFPGPNPIPDPAAPDAPYPLPDSVSRLRAHPTTAQRMVTALATSGFPPGARLPVWYVMEPLVTEYYLHEFVYSMGAAARTAATSEQQSQLMEEASRTLLLVTYALLAFRRVTGCAHGDFHGNNVLVKKLSRRVTLRLESLDGPAAPPLLVPHVLYFPYVIDVDRMCAIRVEPRSADYMDFKCTLEAYSIAFACEIDAKLRIVPTHQLRKKYIEVAHELLEQKSRAPGAGVPFPFPEDTLDVSTLTGMGGNPPPPEDPTVATTFTDAHIDVLRDSAFPFFQGNSKAVTAEARERVAALGLDFARAPLRYGSAPRMGPPGGRADTGFGDVATPTVPIETVDAARKLRADADNDAIDERIDALTAEFLGPRGAARIAEEAAAALERAAQIAAASPSYAATRKRGASEEGGGGGPLQRLRLQISARLTAPSVAARLMLVEDRIVSEHEIPDIPGVASMLWGVLGNILVRVMVLKPAAPFPLPASDEDFPGCASFWTHEDIPSPLPPTLSGRRFLVVPDSHGSTPLGEVLPRLPDSVRHWLAIKLLRAVAAFTRPHGNLWFARMRIAVGGELLLPIPLPAAPLPPHASSLAIADDAAIAQTRDFRAAAAAVVAICPEMQGECAVAGSLEELLAAVDTRGKGKTMGAGDRFSAPAAGAPSTSLDVFGALYSSYVAGKGRLRLQRRADGFVLQNGRVEAPVTLFMASNIASWRGMPQLLAARLSSVPFFPRLAFSGARLTGPLSHPFAVAECLDSPVTTSLLEYRTRVTRAGTAAAVTLAYLLLLAARLFKTATGCDSQNLTQTNIRLRRFSPPVTLRFRGAVEITLPCVDALPVFSRVFETAATDAPVTRRPDDLAILAFVEALAGRTPVFEAARVEAATHPEPFSTLLFARLGAAAAAVAPVPRAALLEYVISEEELQAPVCPDPEDATAEYPVAALDKTRRILPVLPL